MRSEISNSRKIRLLLVLLSLLICHTAAFAQDKAHKIDELLSLYHKYGQFNGAALVAENGKVIYKKGFGQANMEWNIPNEPDTKFRLGSITKQFTAALILQLVEAGQDQTGWERFKLPAGLSQGNGRQDYYSPFADPHVGPSQLHRCTRVLRERQSQSL